jgi:predicted alpha/beta-hydrolase family hydrolase
MSAATRPVTIEAGAAGAVSGLLLAPKAARAAYVFAHGAGAGMDHPFLAKAAEGLATRGIATLRYQFPYMERGSKRPDSPAVAQAAVRGAVARAAQLLPGTPLFAGGKSFGGRMTSQAQAAQALAGVRGLAFLGFPLHAAGQPSDARAKHLGEVEVPMLFLQGTRDALADSQLMRTLAKRLGQRATLAFFDEADHSFHVPARTGRKDTEVLEDVLDTLSQWIKS